jgi:hypothetical protein
MARVICTLSQDAKSEIRRKVLQARQSTKIGITRADGREIQGIVEHDQSIIRFFLTEEFEDFVMELYEGRKVPSPWPDIYSWEYPGEWICEKTSALENFLAGRDKGYIFAKSGLYTLLVETS